ncbi:MAG: type 1 glutamine amidotransferase domain-containing protein [Thermoleophilia bacterium]
MSTDNTLTGVRVAVLVANEGIEQVELTDPLEAVRTAGAEAHIVAPEAGEVQAMNHLSAADRFPVDRTLDEVTPDQYDALLLPGGVANPDRLRTDPRAVDFVRRFVRDGKPVGAICHAPWMLVEAGVLEGRTITSWPSLATDIENAGGTRVDREVCTDGNLVSSRSPEDLPAFNDAVVRLFASAGSAASPAER